METVLKVAFGIIIGAVGFLGYDYHTMLQARKQGLVRAWVYPDTGEIVASPNSPRTKTAAPKQAEEAKPEPAQPKRKPRNTLFGREQER